MEQQEPHVPLVAYTLSAVRKTNGGFEPFEVPEDGRKIVEAATRALLMSPAPEKEKFAALKRVLSIARALETKYASPNACRALTDALSASPKAAQLLGLETSGLRKRQRNMERFLDASTVRRAPKLHAPAPMASMRLSSMLASRTREYR